MNLINASLKQNIYSDVACIEYHLKQGRELNLRLS